MKKKKTKKKSLEKRLRKILWDLCKEYIRRRDDGQCITCPTQKLYQEMHTGHCFGKKAHPFVRYEEINLACQCAGCNTFKEGEHAEFFAKIQELHGMEKAQELRLKAKSSMKLTIFDLEALIEEYKSKLSNL